MNQNAQWNSEIYTEYCFSYIPTLYRETYFVALQTILDLDPLVISVKGHAQLDTRIYEHVTEAATYTTCNIHNGRTSIPSGIFEPTIPAI